jgi:ribonuclease M5
MTSVFIIEGWSDDDKLRKVYPDIKTIVTNGTKFNRRVKNKINEHQAKGNTVYILSDPDYAGDQLAEMIWRGYPELRRIRVDPMMATCLRGTKLKYGVEFLGYSYIRELLGDYMSQKEEDGNGVERS